MAIKGDFKAFYKPEEKSIYRLQSTPFGADPYCEDDSTVSKETYAAQLALVGKVGMRCDVTVDASNPIHAGEGPRITAAFERAVELVADTCGSNPPGDTDFEAWMARQSFGDETDQMGPIPENVCAQTEPVVIGRDRLSLAEIADACELNVNTLRGLTGPKSDVGVKVEIFSHLVSGLASVLWPGGETPLDKRYLAAGGRGTLISRLNFCGWPQVSPGAKRELAALMLLGQNPISGQLAFQKAQERKHAKNLRHKMDLYRLAALTCALLNEQDLRIILNVAQTLRRRSVAERAWVPGKEAWDVFNPPQKAWERDDGKLVDGNRYDWHLELVEGEITGQHYVDGKAENLTSSSSALLFFSDDDQSPVFGHFGDDGEFIEEHLDEGEENVLIWLDRERGTVMGTDFRSEVAWLVANAPEWTRDVLVSFASDFKSPRGQ